MRRWRHESRKTALNGIACGYRRGAPLSQASSLHPRVCHAESTKWSGVDESVVEKYAKEHGREARAPLINTDQGDLLLFVFLLAGALGGFVAGYYWRTLMDQKKKTLPEERAKTS